MLALVSDTGILVAVVAFVALFGASQIPKLARNLGEAGREFRRAHAEMEPPSPPLAPPAPSLAPAGQVDPDDRITLTRAQLDALLGHPAPADGRA